MIIRKAVEKEISLIMNIVKRVIADMISRGVEQWDDIYPDIEVIRRDAAEGNLYVYEDETIKGIIVVNELQDREYESVKWENQLSNPLVIHRLCIDPQFQGLGIARTLIDFAEAYSKETGHDSIRLDTFAYNEKACKLYEQKGYKKVGTVNFRKGEFYCYEKNMV